jgi:hypothetical protein
VCVCGGGGGTNQGGAWPGAGGGGGGLHKIRAASTHDQSVAMAAGVLPLFKGVPVSGSGVLWGPADFGPFNCICKGSMPAVNQMGLQAQAVGLLVKDCPGPLASPCCSLQPVVTHVRRRQPVLLRHMACAKSNPPPPPGRVRTCGLY